MTFDQDAPLSRIPYETQKSHDALMDYFLMGAGRSLAKLHQKYTKAIPNPPTLHIATLKKWSTRYHWQARIARQKEIDDEIALEQYRKDHMSKEEVLKRLSDMGRSDIADFADVRQPSDLEGKLNSHVVKKITVNARRNKDGTITARTVIELYDAQGALEKLARHHGLFKDRLDITSGDQPFTIDDLTQATQELADWEDENSSDPDPTD